VQVRDVMTEATITETPADKLRSAAERLWREQTGSLLTSTDGRLTGIITERDVLRAVALGADPDRATVDEAMTIDVFTVPRTCRCTWRGGRWPRAGSGTCGRSRTGSHSASSVCTTLPVRSARWAPGTARSTSSTNSTSWSASASWPVSSAATWPRRAGRR
jgi:CBS domain